MVVLEEGMSNPSFMLSPAFIYQKFVKILASPLKEVNNPTDISFAILAKME